MHERLRTVSVGIEWRLSPDQVIDLSGFQFAVDAVRAVKELTGV